MYVIQDSLSSQFLGYGYLDFVDDLNKAKAYPTKEAADSGLENIKTSIKIQRDLQDRLSPDSLGDNTKRHTWCRTYDTSKLKLIECVLVLKSQTITRSDVMV